MKPDPIPIVEPGQPPPAPAKLAEAGAELWNQTVELFELLPGELSVLESTCRLADDEARLTAALGKAAGVLVKGSMGQKRVNPLFAEVRQTRLALARLLDSLGLNDAATDGSAKSHAGRRLARMRWSGRSTARHG